MSQELEKLIHPERVYSRIDVLGKQSPVPKKSGVYAWFFSEDLSMVPALDCVKINGLNLLYVGIAPRRPSKEGKISKRNLHSRIRYHYKGNAYGSTLRLSLGCLLAEKLNIQLRRIGKSGKRMNFTIEGEALLSSWMEENAFVSWIQREAPWELEEKAITELPLPLNLKGNRHHPFYSVLKNVRKEEKEKARNLFIM